MRIIWRACLSALSLNGTPLDRLPSHYPTLPGITASPRTLRATPLVVLDRGRRPCETASRATRRLTCDELAINDLMLTQNHLENRCAPLDDTMNKKSNGGFLHSPKGDSSVNQAINNIFSPGHDHAYNTPLADLDVSDPTLWPNQAMWAVFKRLRDEDPLHYCKDGWNSIARSPEDETVGPYWSVTRYEDIMAIDTDHHRFSSEPFITLQNPADDFPLPMFIAMDQPKHDIQRQTIAPVVASPSLSRMSELIRERTQTVLDEIPLNEEFDWVDTVSIELTTMMLATLFDFPFEDRRKLTRWSDVATASPETGIVESETQRRAELMECVEYFMALWQQRIGKEGHDLITLLANGENTRDMEPMEYLGNLILLIVGGNDTTRNSMSGSVYGSHLFPSEWEKVRANRDLIPIPSQRLSVGRRPWPICDAPHSRMSNYTVRPSRRETKWPCGTHRAIAMSESLTTRTRYFLIAKTPATIFPLALAFTAALATASQRCSCKSYGKKCCNVSQRLRWWRNRAAIFQAS